MPESITRLTERFDLQVALLAIGAFLLFALLLYNFFRTKKLKNQLLDSALKSMPDEQIETSPIPHIQMDDSPLEAVKIEPTFQDSNVHLSELTQEVHPTIPQDTHSVDQEEVAQIYSSRMDPNIDCVVVLRFSLLVNGKEILEHMTTWPQNPTYRIASEGLYEFDGVSSWELINEQHDYREIQLSMQLANRRGPISQEELSEYLGMAADLAHQIDAEIDLPPISQVLSQAQDLDQFSVQCDIQLGFNLIPNMISWATKDVEAALLNKGFLLSRDGVFFNYFSGQHLLFKVQIPGLNFLTDDLQTYRIKSILFALDVPLVPEHLDAFPKMLEVSQQLAHELDGKVLDDNGQVLEMSSVNTIVAQLEPIYQLMREWQILPGSSSAARLFS